MLAIRPKVGQHRWSLILAEGSIGYTEELSHTGQTHPLMFYSAGILRTFPWEQLCPARQTSKLAIQP